MLVCTMFLQPHAVRDLSHTTSGDDVLMLCRQCWPQLESNLELGSGDWVKDMTGGEWVVLGWGVVLCCVVLCCVVLCCVVLCCVVLCCVVLCWVGLGWVGLG